MNTVTRPVASHDVIDYTVHMLAPTTVLVWRASAFQLLNSSSPAGKTGSTKYWRKSEPSMPRMIG